MRRVYLICADVIYADVVKNHVLKHHVVKNHVLKNHVVKNHVLKHTAIGRRRREPAASALADLEGAGLRKITQRCL